MSDELKEKIMKNVVVDPESGCWNWVFEAKKGRLVIRHEGKQAEAKRLFFSIFIGEVFFENIRYKQTCGNKKCVNPDHLKIISHLDLMQEVKKLDFCKNGHKLNEENTSIICSKKYGTKRRCKKCDRERAAQKRKAEKVHDLICDYCGVTFIGSNSQSKNKKIGKNIFCCIGCKNKHYAVKKP